MMDRKLGIVVGAVGIGKDVQSRFTTTLASTTHHARYDCDMVVGHGDFSRSRVRNVGIRGSMLSHQVIVCTDVDMLVPPGLVQATLGVVCDGVAVWAKCRNIEAADAGMLNWKEWLKLPIREGGTGSWVAMTVADWLKLGGWDERLTGHGGEDDILALRREEHGIETRVFRDFPLVHVNHPPRDKQHRGGNKENLRIGRTQPTENYLTARSRVLDDYNNHFNFFVTSRCTRDCPECSQRGFRRGSSDPLSYYELSLETLSKWIDDTKASGYPPYRSLILTGGEPLLWEHLEEGVRMLRDSGLGHQVNIFTNGDLVSRVTDTLMDAVTTLRVSHYGDNAAAIEQLQKRYGSKVEIAQRQRHYPIPTALAGNEVLPAKCGCEGPALLGDRVYGCPMLVTVANEHGMDLSRYPESHCRLQAGYLELLANFPRTRHDCCRGCIGNLALRKETVSAT